MDDSTMNHHDDGEMSDRVSTLEKKVHKLEDEIVCLKSALSDVIRQVGQIDPNKGSAQSGGNVASSKPKLRPVVAKRGPQASSNVRSSQLNPLDSPPTQSRNQPIKKWSSSTEMSGSHAAQASHSQSKQERDSNKNSPWNPDEGYMKLYLKGRGIALYAPSDIEDFQPNKQNSAPNEKLMLEWVYGYRGRDCRSNLYYLPTGEVVYFVAAVVVLYNVEEQMQRHYFGHTDDVRCIALHPDKVRIASGQVAGHDKKERKRVSKEQLKHPVSKDIQPSEVWPHVRIWDSVSLKTLQIIGLGDFDRAVCCVAFSRSDGGQQLVAVDEANEHVISLWDVSKDKPHKITETKSSTEPVLAAEFHPTDRNSIVTCGKAQLAFWTVESGALSKKMGIFDRHEKPKYVLCLTFADNGDLLTGDSNGNIFVWGRGGNRISEAVNGAHDGGVFSLCITKDGNILSGGGKDRKIVQWDSNFEKTGLETELSEEFGAIRVLSQGKGNLLLVGTTRNCILQGTLDLRLSPIVQGHVEELWGLAVHPNQHQFLTCAYDKYVYLWDVLSHTVIWRMELPESAHCCCFHPSGTLVAIGTQSSSWLVIDLTSRDVIHLHSDGNEQIEAIQFSPAGHYLAVGSRDNHVYIYQVTSDGYQYSKVGRCSGHSSFITHLDWSSDSTCLRSNSGDYEVLYWSASSAKQLVSPAHIRDILWATQNCVIDFSVAGIWPEGADGTDVNGCARSHQGHLVASGDDFGKVNLYKYPCPYLKSACRSYVGHSSHVTGVAFVSDDSRLISTGGRDTAIMQWEVM